jgi:hypothetical protein
MITEPFLRVIASCVQCLRFLRKHNVDIWNRMTSRRFRHRALYLSGCVWWRRDNRLRGYHTFCFGASCILRLQLSLPSLTCYASHPLSGTHRNWAKDSSLISRAVLGTRLRCLLHVGHDTGFVPSCRTFGTRVWYTRGCRGFGSRGIGCWVVGSRENGCGGFGDCGDHDWEGESDD